MVLIFVDSANRDGLTYTLIAHELSKLNPNLHIELVSFDLWQEALGLLDPDIVVLNHLIGNRNRAIAKEVYRKKKQVVILPTEGRPNTVSQEEWVKQKTSPFYHHYLAWNSVVDMERMTVTGNPRFNIYTHYRKLCNSSVLSGRYRIPQEDEIIGITTSFPQAKFAYTGVDFNIRDWKDLGVDGVIGDALTVAKSELKKLKEFQTYVEEVHLENPDSWLLIKPHPMEDMTLWWNWQRELPNNRKVIIVENAEMHNFLPVIDRLIARYGCTTLQDAHAFDMTLPVVEWGTPDAPDNEMDATWTYSQTCDPVEKRDILEKYHTLSINSILEISHFLHELTTDNTPLKSASYITQLNKFRAIQVAHAQHHILPTISKENLHFGKSFTLTTRRYYNKLIQQHGY